MSEPTVHVVVDDVDGGFAHACFLEPVDEGPGR